MRDIVKFLYFKRGTFELIDHPACNIQQPVKFEDNPDAWRKVDVVRVHLQEGLKSSQVDELIALIGSYDYLGYRYVDVHCQGATTHVDTFLRKLAALDPGASYIIKVLDLHPTVPVPLEIMTVKRSEPIVFKPGYDIRLWFSTLYGEVNNDWEPRAGPIDYNPFIAGLAASETYVQVIELDCGVVNWNAIRDVADRRKATRISLYDCILDFEEDNRLASLQNIEWHLFNCRPRLGEMTEHALRPFFALNSLRNLRLTLRNENDVHCAAFNSPAPESLLACLSSAIREDNAHFERLWLEVGQSGLDLDFAPLVAAVMRGSVESLTLDGAFDQLDIVFPTEAESVVNNRLVSMKLYGCTLSRVSSLTFFHGLQRLEMDNRCHCMEGHMGDWAAIFSMDSLRALAIFASSHHSRAPIYA